MKHLCEVGDAVDVTHLSNTLEARKWSLTYRETGNKVMTMYCTVAAGGVRGNKVLTQGPASR